MDFFIEPDNIWVAASDGNLSQVKKLIEQGIDINAQDDSGYSPLHAASSYGEMEVLEYLLSTGANLELRDEDGDTPLLVCEASTVFERLVQAGANPNAKNNADQGIVEKAVEDDNEELIAYLLANGYITDPNFKYTPGECADDDVEFDIEEQSDGNGDGEENNNNMDDNDAEIANNDEAV